MSLMVITLIAIVVAAYITWVVYEIARRRRPESPLDPPVLWGASQSFIIVGLFLFMSLVAVVAVSVLTPRVDRGSPSLIIMVLAFTYVFNIPTLILAMHFAGPLGSPMRALGFSGVPLSLSAKRAFITFLFIFPGQLAFQSIVVTVWSAVTSQPPPEQAVVEPFRYANGIHLAALVVMASVMAPFFEEIVFRGFFQSGIANSLGPIPAIILTAVLFAAVHSQNYDIATGIALLPLSLVLSAFYYAKRDLVANMILHGMFNGVSTAVIIIARAYNNTL